MDFTVNDRQQFAQLIGYSLSGYGELTSYVDDVAYCAATNMAEGMDGRDARIAALELKLAQMSFLIDQLRTPLVHLLGTHPMGLST
jgi:hypothetical protein